MMESIEELRNFGHSIVCTGQMERALDEFADEIEREIAEKYMELPVDADGMPIHVGDVLEYDYGDDVRGTHMVCALIYDGTRSKEFDGGIWDFEFDDDDKGDSRNVHCMSDFYECNRHVKPDPVKELLEEFAHKGVRVGATDPIPASLRMYPDKEAIDEYAAKIREAVSAE